MINWTEIINSNLKELEFKAKEKNISINFLHKNEIKNIKGEPIILSLLVRNLLDNAIHACMTLSKETFPQIFLKLKYYDESLFIDIKNSVQKNFDLTKVKERIGIKNIKQSVEKNSGIYSQILEEDKYCVQIILWDYKGENENE